MLKSEIERSRRKPPDSLAAYDLYLRALPHLTFPVPAEARIAAPLLEDALRLDPGFATARAWLARCHEVFFMWGGLDPRDFTAGVAQAEMVVASQTDDATALAIAGFLLWQLARDYDRSVATLERALSFNPCCVTALMSGALVYAYGAQAGKAKTLAERGLRLSPFDPSAWIGHVCFGNAAVVEQRPDDAASHYAAAVHLSPQFAALHACHAMALALADRREEAGAAVRRTLELDPSFRFGPVVQLLHDPGFADTLRKGALLAGLPE